MSTETILVNAFDNLTVQEHPYREFFKYMFDNVPASIVTLTHDGVNGSVKFNSKYEAAFLAAASSYTGATVTVTKETSDGNLFFDCVYSMVLS